MDFEKKYKEDYYDSFEKKAEKIISNTEKTKKLLDDAITKVNQISTGPVEEVWGSMLIFIDLISDWLKGNYRNIPLGSIIMVVASMVYFLAPFDIIPDFIIGLGYIDDMAILSYTFKQIQSDIDKYLVWKSIRDIGDNIE